MDTIILGTVEVGRVREVQGPFAPTGDLVPGAPEELWARSGAAARQDGLAVLALQTWVLRSEGRTILVDTGVGTQRFPIETDDRPNLPDLLAEHGVRPDEVDVVINTHVHADHVGWNTTEADSERVPTFPNARYLIPAADNAAFAGNAVHTANVAPIVKAGLADFWDGEHRVDANLVLTTVGGHTPGLGVLRLDSGGERAAFVGDLVHSPVQILDPAHSSCFDEDAAAAAKSRTAVLARAADDNALVFPAHFGGAGAVEVVRDGDRFAIKGFAAFPA